MTPSDAGPWMTLWDEQTLHTPHVVPIFGPPHRLSLSCWCWPEIDRERYEHDGHPVAAVVHNVAQ